MSNDKSAAIGRPLTKAESDAAAAEWKDRWEAAQSEPLTASMRRITRERRARFTNTSQKAMECQKLIDLQLQ